MAKAIWALDIGEYSLKVCRARQINKSSGVITVDLFDIIRYADLPCGYEAHVTERYHEGIRAFLEKHHVAKGDRVCVSVTGHEVFSRFINLPPVSLKRVPEIVRYEARQQIPFNIDEVVWDYQPVKDAFEPGEEIEIGLFALKRERINEFMEMLEPLRSSLYCIQAAPLAIFNFLVYDEAVTEPMIVLDIGAHTTDLLVMDLPKFWLRPVLVAGDNITMAIQQEFNVSKEEAETIKERVGTSKHARQVFDVVRPVVQNLVSEVQRSLGYYKSVAAEVKFAKVLGLGGSFKLPGMDKLVAENLQYEVQQLDKVNKFEPGPGVDQTLWKENLAGAGVALGLLVQGFEQSRMKLNLVPTEVLKEVEINRKKPFLLASAVCLLLMVILLWFSNKLLASDLERGEKAGVETEMMIKNLADRYQRAKAEVDAAIGPVTDLLDVGFNRADWVRVLPGLSSVIPEGRAYLSRIEIDWKTQAEINTETSSEDKKPIAPVNIWEQYEREPTEGGEATAVEGMAGTESEGPALSGPTAPVKAGVTKPSNTLMTIYIYGESANREVSFIDDQIVGKLKTYKWNPDTKVPVFKDVRRLGVPKIVFRNPIDGRPVSPQEAQKPCVVAMPDGSKIELPYERYIDFKIRVVLKTPADIKADMQKLEEEERQRAEKVKASE